MAGEAHGTAGGKVGAAAVILRDGHILLMRRSASGREYHTFPGGRPNPGESPEEACRREIEREARVAVSELAPLAVLEAEGALSHLFLAKDWEGGPAMGDAESGLMEDRRVPDWVPLSRVKELVLTPEALHAWLIFYLLTRG
jgi:ADP-ribose pyrophosphatase YjhB (NUDIX family)